MPIITHNLVDHWIEDIGKNAELYAGRFGLIGLINDKKGISRLYFLSRENGVNHDRIGLTLIGNLNDLRYGGDYRKKLFVHQMPIRNWI